MGYGIWDMDMDMDMDVDVDMDMDMDIDMDIDIDMEYGMSCLMIASLMSTRVVVLLLLLRPWPSVGAEKVCIMYRITVPIAEEPSRLAMTNHPGTTDERQRRLEGNLSRSGYHVGGQGSRQVQCKMPQRVCRMT